MCAFRQDRVEIPEDEGPERIRGFELLLDPYTREEAQDEAQRCLQCAMPYCVQACPITQDCRGYILSIAQGRFDEAAVVTLRDNPLATVLCKTCYHYCEEDCIKGERGTAIAIRHLKRAALEHGGSNRRYVPQPPNGLKVAIVGAGPAGLMAAWELALRGYKVVVFEEKPFLGGQIDTIPRYHLNGDELATDLARWSSLDVTFRTQQKAGREFDPEDLLRQGFEAVYLALGTPDPRSLGLPGENLPGVFYAIQFLLAMNVGSVPLLGRKGRQVVVVGGGDVALDAARSARRLEPAGQVTVVYRRSREEMPASREEAEGGEAEGVVFLFQRTPVRILGTERVQGLVVQRTEPGPPGADGRRPWRAIPGSEETVPCDTVILAVGEKVDLDGFPDDLQLKPGPHGYAVGSRPDMMTAVPGIFASGGRSVVYAMAAGRLAAEAIEEYIAHRHGTTPRPRPDPFGGNDAPRLPEGYGGPTWHL
jgi:NADPH-dependent glutamate synthase beta subunit-like oxidoreductase